MNAIYILWIRQLKRYVRSKSRMVGSLGQPLLFLLALGFGFGPIYSKAGGGDYFQFIAPGIITMGIMFTAVFSGIEILWDRQFGFLKETLVAPVSRLEIMIGRTLGGATVAFVQGFIVFLISVLFGLRPQSLVLLPLAFVAMFLVALLFTSFGTAIASGMQDMQAFPLIMNFVMMPLFFLSGSLFPLDGLPPVMADVAVLNPLSYGVDALRATLVNGSHFGLGLDMLVLGGATAVMVVLGSYLFSKIQI